MTTFTAEANTFAAIQRDTQVAEERDRYAAVMSEYAGRLGDLSTAAEHGRLLVYLAARHAVDLATVTRWARAYRLTRALTLPWEE